MPVAYRRGFKAEANAYAREFRAELGLEPHDPLCPWALAGHLGIPVLPLSAFAADAPGAVGHLTGPGRAVLSAVTVLRGRRRLIVHNDAHHPRRQAANIAHELAHGILGHPPAPPLDERGCRHFDRTLEAEADWLGPALLVSEEAALHVVESGISVGEAAGVYKVSVALLEMRIGVTGARRRVERRRDRHLCGA
jgi:hypothetical protein